MKRFNISLLLILFSACLLSASVTSIHLSDADVMFVNNINNTEKTHKDCSVEIKCVQQPSDNYTSLSINWSEAMKSNTQNCMFIAGSHSKSYLNQSQPVFKNELFSTYENILTKGGTLKKKCEMPFYYEIMSQTGADHRYSYNCIFAFKADSKLLFVVLTKTVDERDGKILFIDCLITDVTVSQLNDIANMLRFAIPKITVTR